MAQGSSNVKVKTGTKSGAKGLKGRPERLSASLPKQQRASAKKLFG